MAEQDSLGGVGWKPRKAAVVIPDSHWRADCIAARFQILLTFPRFL